MIIDTLANASKYTSLNPLFAQAFDYIKAQDLSKLPIGVSEIGEGLKMISKQLMAQEITQPSNQNQNQF
jgi:beta-galactosidase beta subunit